MKSEVSKCKMSVISKEYLVDEDLEEKTATYRIKIRNFRRKLGKAQRGEEVSSEKFFVNWSEFSIDLFIAGDDEDDSDVADVDKNYQIGR